MVDLGDKAASMPGHIHSLPLGVKHRLSEMPHLTPHKHPLVIFWVDRLSMAMLYLEDVHVRSGEGSSLVLAR